MKKGKKITLIVAGCLVLAGLIIAAVGLAVVQFDASRLNTVNYETIHYEIEEGFHHISIDGVGSDVRLYPSEYDTCRVVCTENKDVPFEVTVKDDTLYIQRQGSFNRQLQFGVYWGETGISVYLPEEAYESLTIRTSSGSISVPEDLQFASADVRSTSGEITLLSSVNGEQSVSSQSGNIRVQNAAPESLTVQSTSGEITLENLKVRTSLQTKSTSGDVAFTNVQGKTITAYTSSGEITLTQAIAEDDIRLQSTSGEIELRNSDGSELYIKTTSGNVSGTLLSEKVFRIDTTSGTVDAPYSGSGGKCEVSTTSGDVEFTIVPEIS